MISKIRAVNSAASSVEYLLDENSREEKGLAKVIAGNRDVIIELEEMAKGNKKKVTEIILSLKEQITESQAYEISNIFCENLLAIDSSEYYKFVVLHNDKKTSDIHILIPNFNFLTGTGLDIFLDISATKNNNTLDFELIETTKKYIRDKYNLENPYTNLRIVQKEAYNIKNNDKLEDVKQLALISKTKDEFIILCKHFLNINISSITNTRNIYRARNDEKIKIAGEFLKKFYDEKNHKESLSTKIIKKIQAMSKKETIEYLSQLKSKKRERTQEHYKAAYKRAAEICLSKNEIDKNKLEDYVNKSFEKNFNNEKRDLIEEIFKNYVEKYDKEANKDILEKVFNEIETVKSLEEIREDFYLIKNETKNMDIKTAMINSLTFALSSEDNRLEISKKIESLIKIEKGSMYDLALRRINAKYERREITIIEYQKEKEEIKDKYKHEFELVKMDYLKMDYLRNKKLSTPEEQKIVKIHEREKKGEEK